MLHDDDFNHFVRYGRQVTAHNVQNDEKKTSQNLWYGEALPPDTLFYFLATARPGHGEGLERLRRALAGPRPYLQVGGNETVGQGWCATAVLESQGVRA